MANCVQFAVSDTSPTILYSPFGDTFSTPNLSAGWNPYFTLSGFASALGEVGNGTSLHITSNNGSSLLVQFHGVRIQLWGNTTSASYSITIDGAPFTPADQSDNGLLAYIEDLADAPHTVVLTAIIPTVQNPPNSSLVVFEKAVIDSSPAPPNVNFDTETVDDNDIAFHGRWSFETAPSGTAFHTSQALGDIAVTNFSGTTLLLQGITSPQSGNYTVTVDNVTTSLSARSSFTSYDSLLFFVTELDPASVHSVQVANAGGGNLSLLVGGFSSFVPFFNSSFPTPPPPPPPPSILSINEPFSQGTIAAFILAGLLAFIFFSALIFLFFVYRPRRRRRRLLAESRRRDFKEHEASVIDIGPEFVTHIDLDQQDSVSPGLPRWRRGVVEDDPGIQPISFRHSNSWDEKLSSPMSDVPRDDISDSSSTRRKTQAKSKGKAKQITGRSWSPSITFDFSIRRSRSHRRSSVPRTAESLSYVSTFMAAEPSSPTNLAPPSYAASVSNHGSNSHTNSLSHRSSDMPSVPRSVSQRGSTGGSLKPPEAIPMKPLARNDRGSTVKDNLNDNQDVLGPASLQQAIRSLSPRITGHPYAIQDEDQDSIQTLPSPQETKDNALLTILSEAPSNDDDLVEVRDGVFLNVGVPSPFQLTFDTSYIKPDTTYNSNSSGHLHLNTSSSSRKPAQKSFGSVELPNPDDDTRPPVPDLVQGTSNMRFRLTPLSIPPISASPHSESSNDSAGVTSFLDLSGSREGSLASHPTKTTGSKERQRSNLSSPVFEEKSRWSNTTVPSMGMGSNNGTGSNGNGSPGNSQKVSLSESPPGTFSTPVLVHIPLSAYHGMESSNRRSRISGLTQAAESLHVHPPIESLESPTDNTSMLVSSELQFRQRLSADSITVNSRRTTDSSLVFASSLDSHPTLRGDGFTPRPFDPAILVSRVLGLPSPITTTARLTGHSSSGVLSPSPHASSPSPYASSSASRQDTTNTPGGRSISENSGTNSLGPSSSFSW